MFAFLLHDNRLGNTTVYGCQQLRRVRLEELELELGSVQ